MDLAGRLRHTAIVKGPHNGGDLLNEAALEIERLNGMMRNLVHARFGKPEWDWAMDAIGFHVEESEAAQQRTDTLSGEQS